LNESPVISVRLFRKDEQVVVDKLENRQSQGAQEGNVLN
jgi:hypothetical protein